MASKFYNFRFNEEDLGAIQKCYRDTYPVHALSFNSWVIDALMVAVTEQDILNVKLQAIRRKNDQKKERKSKAG